MKYFLSLFFILWANTSLHAQSQAVLDLEKRVYGLNNAFKYDSSQIEIQNFLQKKDISNEDKYYAYLYLSYTYKRLFDYESTLYNLDKALAFGLLTPRKAYFNANIICQKALALFDISRYHEADSLMQLLAKNKYQHLNEEYQSKIIMQEAYLLYLGKKYLKSEQKYDVALALMQKASPCDLPMIYGKKIELYGKMQQKSNLMNAYNLSLACADSCHIVKYAIYTQEMYFKVLKEEGEYQKALAIRESYDSLNNLYNKQEHLDKLTQLDKQYQYVLKDYQLKAQEKQMMFLGGIIFILSAVVFLGAYLYVILRKQKQAITHQNEVNEQLIYILSHDIKEPLLGVRLLLKKLKHDNIYLTQASQSLEDQISSVNGILSNLLQFKKADSQKENTTTSSKEIHEIFQALKNELSAKLERKNLHLEINISQEKIPSLPISPEKLHIICLNILSNAIKYSFLNNKIIVSETTEGIAIQDFGIGIANDKKNSLLKEVLSSQKGTDNEIGNGLGFYLIGQLLKDSKVKIEFESPENGGTIVKIMRK